MDDEVDLLHGLKQNLKLVGYKVETATCGFEAINMLNQHDFDMVITDMRMPKGTGMDLLKSIRDKSDSTPVICFVTDCTDKQLQEIESFGVMGTLSKPFEFKELLEVIKKVS